MTLHQAHLPYYHISYIYDEENREFNALFDKMMRRAIELCGMLEIDTTDFEKVDPERIVAQVEKLLEDQQR